MITLGFVYVVAGVVFAAFAGLSAIDVSNPKRFGNAAFWGLLAVSFLAGDDLGDLGNGVLVMGLVVLAGAGALGRGQPVTTGREARHVESAARGNKLFLPALAIPVAALLGTLLFKNLSISGAPLIDPKQVTLISLGFGMLIALAAAMLWLRPPMVAPLQEGRRLIDSVGWAAVLPQMLAALGAVFAMAGVGAVVGELVSGVIPAGNRLAAVAAYTVGMALFTMIMGNAFAAFPVMTAAVGLPLVVRQFGGDPAIVSAIGMLAGF